MLFDKEGRIQKFTSEAELLESFAEVRLQYYFKRKDYLLEKLRQQREILSEKARFIELVIAEKLKVKNRKREALIDDLRKNDFRTYYEITDGDDVDVDGEKDAGDQPAEGQSTQKKKKRSGGWEYLLGMPLWSLTKERVQDLQKQLEAKEKELEELEFTAPEELWERDLDAILDELDAIDLRLSMTAEEERRIVRSARRPAAGAMGPAAKRRRTSSFTAAPPVPVLTGAAIATSSSFRDLQDRQLSSCSEKFPTLFKDLKKSQLASAPAPSPMGAVPSKPSLGSFAQRSGFGRLRPPTAPGQGQQTPSGALYAGAVVTLQGLQLTDMNGRRGTVRRHDEASGRWEVEVDGQGVKRLKSDNLKLLGSKS